MARTAGAGPRAEPAGCAGSPAAVGLVVEDDVAAAAPDVRADGGEGHGWRDELAAG